MKHTLLAAVIAVGLGACAGVTVTPVANPHGSAGKPLGATDSGVRFYRPKLHVWLTRAEPSDKVGVQSTQRTTTDMNPGTTKETTLSKETVGDKPKVTTEKTTGQNVEVVDSATVSTAGIKWKAEIVVLPDFSQEYVIEWKAGMGSATPSFTLTDGWNLTAFESAVDSKASEFITSLATAAAALVASPTWQGEGLYRLDIADCPQIVNAAGAVVLPRAQGCIKLGHRVIALD